MTIRFKATITTIILVLAGIIFIEQKQDKNIADIFKNAFRKERVDSDSSSKLADNVFSYYQKQGLVEFQYQEQIKNIDLFNLQNFDTPSSISKVLSVINGAINEIDTHEERTARILAGAQNIVDESDLFKSAKEEFMAEFKMFIDNPKTHDLAVDIQQKTRKVLAKYAELYKFMLDNYQNYSLPHVGDGKRQVVFNQEHQKAYNQLLINIDVSVLELRVAQLAYDKFIQKQNIK